MTGSYPLIPPTAAVGQKDVVFESWLLFTADPSMPGFYGILHHVNKKRREGASPQPCRAVLSFVLQSFMSVLDLASG